LINKDLNKTHNNHSLLYQLNKVNGEKTVDKSFTPLPTQAGLSETQKPHRLRDGVFASIYRFEKRF
jgi:hypothetical protein